MTAVIEGNPRLVSGGNVTGKAVAGTTRGRAVLNTWEMIVTLGLLLGGSVMLVATAVMSSLSVNSIEKSTVRTVATATTFTSTFTSHGTGAMPSLTLPLLGVGFAAVLAAMVIRQIVFRQAARIFLRMVVQTLLGVTAFSLMIALGITMIVGLMFNLGAADRLAAKQGAQMQAAADSWIAQNLNLNQSGYEVKLYDGQGAHTTYLRNLNPDGTLKNVYALETTDASISIKPVG